MNCVRCVCAAALLGAAVLGAGGPFPKDEGYRGIWFYDQPSKDQYAYKYSGGFATYPQQHAPIAIYSKKANKTFFCYGGTVKGKYSELLHMVSYYDHATGRVPRPTILLNKQTEDAHDNPIMSMDDDGHIWIFSAAHGTKRPAFIHRSVKPYSVDDFELVQTTNYSYPQTWFLNGKGFLFLHTRYRRGEGGRYAVRALHWMTSREGREWSEPQVLATALQGHYQVSWPGPDGRVGTAFDVHPPPLGLNERTNLYYLETADMGKTWTTAAGRPVPTPIETEDSPALVRDYHKEKVLVYLKDLQYDASGRPVIVFMTGKGYQSGPRNDPRTFQTARWTGKDWAIHPIATADHNYDHGALYIKGARWTFIGPTGAGPQAYGTGGEIEMWGSADSGATWKRERKMTVGSRFNHTYVRRPLNAHPGFWAIWADGDAFGPSGSHLYFANQAGDVFRLPAKMEGAFAQPERVAPGE